MNISELLRKDRRRKLDKINRSLDYNIEVPVSSHKSRNLDANMDKLNTHGLI
jgi:hypothetical protein